MSVKLCGMRKSFVGISACYYYSSSLRKSIITLEGYVSKLWKMHHQEEDRNQPIPDGFVQLNWGGLFWCILTLFPHELVEAIYNKLYVKMKQLCLRRKIITHRKDTIVTTVGRVTYHNKSEHNTLSGIRWMVGGW